MKPNHASHRVIEITACSSKKTGKYLRHVWTNRTVRTLTIKTGTQSHWTGHKISHDGETISLQKSRFHEPGCLAIRFETPARKEKVTLQGKDSQGRNHTAVLEQTTRPAFWRSIILRRADVEMIQAFLTSQNDKWLSAPAPTQHTDKFVSYEDLMRPKEEPECLAQR